ncbi:MAG: MXAN_2562 family outer membrane beta-barrel protein, partial [Anaeromyxobacteraceae bacterium]
LEAGLGAGYFEKYGRGTNSITGLPADSTGFKVLPLRAFLTYRFDFLARLYNIPIVPFGRASLERYQWWVLNGQGNTANSQGLAGRGATNGYSFSGGAAFLLDFLDSGVARDMDRDLGINDTYVFVDFTKSFVKDFGSSQSWNLSDERVTISGGLMFVF